MFNSTYSQLGISTVMNLSIKTLIMDPRFTPTLCSPFPNSEVQHSLQLIRTGAGQANYAMITMPPSNCLTTNHKQSRTILCCH